MAHDARISIIIPVLNEAGFLPPTLKHIEELSGPYEVIIVDAGSTDETLQIARRSAARVLLSKVRQRAKQMNLGASQATGEVLFFLHADTLVNPNSLDAIRDALRDPRTVGGAFARRYNHPSIFLRMTCRLGRVEKQASWMELGRSGYLCKESDF